MAAGVLAGPERRAGGLARGVVAGAVPSRAPGGGGVPGAPLRLRLRHLAEAAPASTPLRRRGGADPRVPDRGTAAGERLQLLCPGSPGQPAQGPVQATT